MFNPSVEIKDARLEDLEEIYKIERESFSDPYPLGLLKTFFFHPGTYLVAVLEGRVVGYAIGIIRFKSLGHIISIAVEKRLRGRGIGKSLLAETIKRLGAMGAKRIRIEVRESNTIAINLYRKMGFFEKERIIRYYPNGETAIVMLLELA